MAVLAPSVLVDKCRERGLLLFRGIGTDGEPCLVVKGAKDAMTPILAETLRTYKSRLLAVVPEEAEVLTSEGPALPPAAPVETEPALDPAEAELRALAAIIDEYGMECATALLAPVAIRKTPFTQDEILLIGDEVEMQPIHAGTTVYRVSELEHLKDYSPRDLCAYHTDKTALLRLWDGTGWVFERAMWKTNQWGKSERQAESYPSAQDLAKKAKLEWERADELISIFCAVGWMTSWHPGHIPLIRLLPRVPPKNVKLVAPMGIKQTDEMDGSNG